MHRTPSVGIVGAGQLARMMAQAAIPLDVRIVLLAASADDGAAQVVPDVIVGAPDDPEALRALADQVDVVTFDHELVDPEALARLQNDGVQVWPSAATMALAQNKRRQRAELGAAGFAVPRFADIDTLADIEVFVQEVGWPIVLKASRGGYDGRGVWVVNAAGAAAEVLQQAVAHGTELLAEEHLSLEREVAVLVARRPSGEMVTYPPVETVQQDGICRELRVPAQIGNTMASFAGQIALDIAARIDLVGIMAIEFFVSHSELYVNELAPRPHNSGHWTIEGAVTSQFEQHLRAVLDWPLGSTEPTGDAIHTLNLLGEGDERDPRRYRSSALAFPGVHVHLYGKGPRPGRKIGHLTAVGDDPVAVGHTVRAASEALFGRGAAKGPA
ncbi:MAG TPA: 5-(carboxyamino)imidazole ribonucleotide synthase [Thermomicrobiales bacterium]|nr:5-(carboxyamino)imidazole ribonucleotide synthase [Thermomicrobiales bacterium]